MVTIPELIQAIENKNQQEGIIVKGPASIKEIEHFEKQVGFQLPDDFKTFYSTCNGFECTEDLFNMLSLNDIVNGIQDYGKGWFHFAEYMIFSEVWALRKKDNRTCEIYKATYEPLVLTGSLEVFLSWFLQGNVFHKGGLYDWQEEMNKSKGNKKDPQ